LSASLTLKVLKAISNPVRKSIIQSLREGTLGFSEIMRICGLNQNYDTGPFAYHLSRLLDLNVIEKAEESYRLTEFGRKIAEFISTVERESLLLLETHQTNLGGEEAKMKEIKAKRLTLKDGRKVILRTLIENELQSARQLIIQTYHEDKYPLSLVQEKYLRHPSLFIGCFNEKEIIGTVFGWPDYPEYPEILVVNAVIVVENYRRKGIGTRLLKDFEKAAVKEGFKSIVLGAEWEAVPFYISYGLDCFANIQITIDKIPWNTIPELGSKYDITGATIFGPSIPNNLISKLNRGLKIKAKSVAANFESISIQIVPKKISKEALEEMKRDFNAYSTQFAFRKKLSG